MLSVAALLLAAAPLRAQDGGVHRFYAGPFSIDLPAEIPELSLMHSGETAGTRVDVFGGGHVDDAVVVVSRSRISLPRDTVELRRLLRRGIRDEARITRYLRMLSDTSQAVRNQILQEMNDTTLAARRLSLRQGRTMWMSMNPPTWVQFSGEAREIVTADRVTLRSPVTLRIPELPPLYGTADMSIQRRGEPVVWIVAYATQRRTAAFDEASARMLSSFRVPGDTGAAAPE